MSDPLETLREYQRWRRGGEGPMLDPTVISQAIDAVMAELERLRLIESAARNLVAVKGRHNSAIAYQRLVEAIDKASAGD